MSMLQYFFEDMRDSKGEHIDNSGIFERLRIMQEGKEYLSHMGTYPVITLTLKAGKHSTFESAYKQLIWQISMEFERHTYLPEVFETMDNLWNFIPFQAVPLK